MSRLGSVRCGALACALWGAAAWAQSPSLLLQVRGHDPLALKTATAELAACGEKTCADAASLRLLAGYLALSSGDAAQAKALLDSLPAPGPLAGFADYYRGEAAFYAHQFADAAQAYAKAVQEGPNWLQVRARHRQADALIEAADFAHALPLIEDVTAGAYGPELLWSHQVASRATGDAAAADADCRTLAVQYPLAPAGVDALAQIGEASLTAKDRLERAQNLVSGGAAQRALEALDALEKAQLPLEPEEEAQLASLREQADYALGKDKDGDREVVRARRGPAKIAAAALFAQAKRRLKLDQHAQARALFVKLERAYPREPQADEAGYLVGWIDLQDRKLPRAITELGAFARKHPHSRKRDDAMWFRALAQIDLKHYGAARKTLHELTQRFPNSSLVPQALYWIHRAEQLEQQPEEAFVQGYGEVIEGFPGSYYALLAAARLEELGKTPPAAFPAPPQALDAPVSPSLSLARALTGAGLFKDASIEVSQQTAHVRDRAAAVALGASLQAIGDFGAAYALAARSLWGAAFHDRDPQALALFFPRAFRPQVEREAKAQNVDPALMWAVMRRESAFDPDQISAANARGLMQLVPPTGAAIARELKLDPPSADGLLVPDLNVKLSSWYLAQLVKRFVHPVLCAAAYNAGPAAVVRWMQNSGKLPLDLFVEQIPYKETRGYVKQVVADLYNYHALYGTGADLHLSLTLPPPATEGVQF